MVNEIVEQLQVAKAAYYAGEPIMGDVEFDALEDVLRQQDPKNEYFKVVGATAGRSKITHGIPMLSAGKAKTVDDVFAWLKKISVHNDFEDMELIVEPKIDGLSATCMYIGGKLQYMATRGNGVEGQDISHVSNYIHLPKIVPAASPDAVTEVRGELVLYKDTALPGAAGKPLRNLAAGLVGRKDAHEDLKHLHFVAYQVYRRPELNTELAKLLWLAGNGYTVSMGNVCKAHQLASIYHSYLTDRRAAWPYETDGLMVVVNNNAYWEDINARYVVDHHPHHLIALKAPSESKETTLTGLECNTSRSGTIIPVALFTPVVIGNRTISRANLSSWSTVARMGLCKGDKIIVECSNDVIPYLSTNIRTGVEQRKLTDKSPELSSDLQPAKCAACGHPAERKGIHMVCSNPYCAERQIAAITHWCKTIGIEFFSEASVRHLYERKIIKGIFDLYALHEQDLISVEGWGEAKIKNVLQQIEKTRTMSIGTFCSALIDGIGEKAVSKLGLQYVGDLLAFNDPQYVIGQQVIDYVRNHKELLIKLTAVLDIKLPEVRRGRTVCMTGKGHKGRKDLAADIAAKGDTFVDSVTKDTQILVCENPQDASGKLQKARKLGVQLMSYQEYFA